MQGESVGGGKEGFWKERMAVTTTSWQIDR